MVVVAEKVVQREHVVRGGARCAKEYVDESQKLRPGDQKSSACAGVYRMWAGVGRREEARGDAHS